MKGVFLLILTVFWSVASVAQKREQYTADFEFKNGIYLSFSDFKNNNPIPITHIVSTYNIQATDYLAQVLNDEYVVYYNNQYEEREVLSSNVWGFSQAGKVRLRHGAFRSSRSPAYSGWYPLVIIGSISYFNAIEAVYRTMPISPSYGMHSGNFYSQDRTYEDQIQVHLLLDFSTGKLIRLTEGSLDAVPTEQISQLLKRDAELYSEFIELPKKEAKKKALFFIRRFNNRNPIYFPVYER